MNATFVRLSALAVIFSMMAVLPADSYGKGKGKDKPNVEAKEKHGREAGELPFGLKQFSEKNGNLLQDCKKMKMTTARQLVDLKMVVIT